MQLFNRGGDKGIRTPDLLNANQTLSQLSYAPKGASSPAAWIVPHQENGVKDAKPKGSGWACSGSNGGPQSYQDCALTS
jgi:hypothetical protein